MAADVTSRRRFLKRLALGSAGLGVAHHFGVVRTVRRWADRSVSRVGAVACPDYSETSLSAAIAAVFEAAGLPPLGGKVVVLKPNFVDHFEGRPVETDSRLILAVALHLKRLGAREVVVAEGPGNRHDLGPALRDSGLEAGLRRERLRFIDLNYDDVDRVAAVAVSEMTADSLLPHLTFPSTLLRAGLVVSMPKLKTHHHVGVTLSLKNLFGCMPGIKYGWPKNLLHWNGIDRSILEIYATLKAQVPMFALVDAVVGMEGDGPLNGSARVAGMLLAGGDLAAVDCMGARLMGLIPQKVVHLGAAELLGLGHSDPDRVELVGAALPRLERPFAVPAKFQSLVG